MKTKTDKFEKWLVGYRGDITREVRRYRAIWDRIPNNANLAALHKAMAYRKAVEHVLRAYRGGK